MDRSFVVGVVGILLLGAVPSGAEQVAAVDVCAAGATAWANYQSYPIYPDATVGWPIPDLSFAPAVQAPTYPHVTQNAGAVYRGPVIGIDATHNNGYSLDPRCPRYLAFQQLLTADGATVVPFVTPFTSVNPWVPNPQYQAALNALDILVIVEPDSISWAEADWLKKWVRGDLGCNNGCDGRGLIVISTKPLANLGSALGVSWDGPNKYVKGTEFTLCGDPRQPIYDPGSLIENHFVTQGLNAAQAVLSVKTFVQGFYLCSSGCSVPDGLNWNSTIALPTSSSSTSFLTSSDGSTSAGVGFQLGAGRVYAGSDPDMFTAVIAAPLIETGFGVPAIIKPTPIGMQAHPPNQQYLLNIVHWIDGLDADAPGTTYEGDACRWEPPLVWPYDRFNN